MTSAAQDPFGEGIRVRRRARLSVLGANFMVESSQAALLQLALDAFGGLSPQRLETRPHDFSVRMIASKHHRTWPQGEEPPRPLLSAGAGLLCATTDAANFTIIDVEQSRALISVSAGMIRHNAYHARCELIELAFITLASRAQRLVPLHAACIGVGDRGVLLVGASGSGKSTLGLHALADGMLFLSEDSAFVALESLRVTGIPNYLHLRPRAVDALQAGELREQIERSPVIRRRSGTLKLEVDLRDIRARIATAPLKLAATVMLSRRPAGRQAALRPLARKAFLQRLRREQPYAFSRANWGEFERRIVTIPAYELRRTRHPDIAIEQLRDVLS